jgi:hypothetical protein
MLLMPVLALLLTAPFARAADISGKWSGTAELKPPDGDAQVVAVKAEFKQTDRTLAGSTGKAGEEQWPIAKGKVEDGKISFEFTAPEGDAMRLYTVRLAVLSETQLQGEFSVDAEGNKLTGKLTLNREK